MALAHERIEVRLDPETRGKRQRQPGAFGVGVGAHPDRGVSRGGGCQERVAAERIGAMEVEGCLA